MLLKPRFVGHEGDEAIVLNLFNFLTILTILATGFLLKDLSARLFVAIGSTVTFVGLMLTAYATSLVQLIFTFSVLVGVGLGFLNPAAFVAILSCFTVHRVYAISVAFAALALGQMVMPMIVEYFAAGFGTQSAFFVITGLSLFGFVGSFFLVPIKWRPCPIQNDFESEPLIEKSSLSRKHIVKEIIQATDLDLLWNFKYITIIFGLGVVFACSSNFNVIFPVYIQVRKTLKFAEGHSKMFDFQKQLNFDATQVNNCIFTIKLSDIISRVGYPLIVNALKLSSRCMFLIGVFGLAAVRIVLLLMDLENYKLLLIVCATLGFFRALTVVNQVLIICDFCEDNCPRKLPGTLGLSVVIKAILLVIFSESFFSLKSFSSDLTFHFYSHICFFTLVIFIWNME